jgi:hypothetical protein
LEDGKLVEISAEEFVVDTKTAFLAQVRHDSCRFRLFWSLRAGKFHGCNREFQNRDVV